MEFPAYLLEQNTIIALAIVGAVIATGGSYILKKNPKRGRFILKSGYAITWLSVALFIAAGFFGK